MGGAGAAIVLAFLVMRGVRHEPLPHPRGVLLITVDTLRADRLGRGRTPALDRLASSGTRFHNARTVAPLTLPAHASLMTGVAPAVHGVRENGRVLGDGLPTLAAVLRDAGYRTGAFVGAYVLDRRFGLSRGFDTYDDRVRRDPDADARLEAERPAGEVVDAAIAWLESLQSPRFFLWVHVYDPHAPYRPPDSFRALPGAHPYDREIAYADAQIGRLLGALQRRGWDRSSVIALAGDHGEGLGAHGEQTHGMLAYDTTLKVPLVLAAPGLPSRDITAPVSLIELPAALLGLAGVAGSTSMLAAQAASSDLLTPSADRDVLAETQYPRAAGWHPIAVLAGGKWKLILSSEAELYDLESDPQESRNRASERPAIVQAMTARLQEARSAGSLEAKSSLAPETAARLRALGYVSGSAAGTVDPAAPNPARMIEAWTRFERVLAALTAGDPRRALEDLTDLAKQHPASPVFQSAYARALQDAGRAGQAVEVLRAAVARWPTDASLYHDLAVAARTAGKVGEAMRAEQAALALDANHPAALNGLGLLHADAGRPADAAAAFERAVGADPSNASYWANLGNARRELGEVAGADEAYRRALECDPSSADAANGMGVLLVQRGQPAGAVAWFERALVHAPDFHEARLNLGIAYQESGQRARAAETYREILRSAPASAARERRAAAELLRSLR